MYLCGLIFPMQCPNFKLVQENWLPTLRNLVARINETFSRNFQEMAVAGEVSLGIHCFAYRECTLWPVWMEGEGGGVKGSRVELARNWQLPANSLLLPPPSPSIHYSILSQLFYLMFLFLRWAWQGLWSIWNTYKSQVQVTAALDLFYIFSKAHFICYWAFCFFKHTPRGSTLVGDHTLWSGGHYEAPIIPLLGGQNE